MAPYRVSRLHKIGKLVFKSWFKSRSTEEVNDAQEFRYLHLRLHDTYYNIPLGTAYTDSTLVALNDIVGTNLLAGTSPKLGARKLGEDTCTSLVEMCEALRAVRDTHIVFRKEFIHNLLKFAIDYAGYYTCSFEKALRTILWFQPSSGGMAEFEFYIRNSADIDSFLYQCYLAYSTFGLTTKVDPDVEAPADFAPYNLTNNIYKDVVLAMYRAGSPRYMFSIDAPILFILATADNLGGWRSTKTLKHITEEYKSKLIRSLYQQ